MSNIDDYIAEITNICHILSDKTRMKIILYLLNKEGNVNEMVEYLKIEQPRISTHLNLLLESKIVTVQIEGRNRYYDIKNKTWMKNLLSIITKSGTASNNVIEIPKRSKEAERLVESNSPIRQARTCYDHLAGVSGVRLLDILLEHGYLEVGEIKKRPNYILTVKGKKTLSELGIKYEKPSNISRKYAYGCPDWTERKYHLGGYLGSRILSYLEQNEILRHDKNERTVYLTKSIEKIFK